MRFSLVIPVYNEAQIITQTIDRILVVLSKLSSDLIWDVIVVDNGSNDGTKEKVLSLNSPKVSLISLSEKGKGLAICFAALKNTSDFFGFIDADLSADPESILSMLDILASNETDIIIGSRFLDTSLVKRDLFRSITSKSFNILQRLILNLIFKDTQCGLKIMNKKGVEVLVLCEEKGWFFDLEFLYLATKNKLSVSEYPISWDEFRYYKERRSKLNFFDSFYAVVAMFRIRSKHLTK